MWMRKRQSAVDFIIFCRRPSASTFVYSGGAVWIIIAEGAWMFVGRMGKVLIYVWLCSMYTSS